MTFLRFRRFLFGCCETLYYAVIIAKLLLNVWMKSKFFFFQNVKSYLEREQWFIDAFKCIIIIIKSYTEAVAVALNFSRALKAEKQTGTQAAQLRQSNIMNTRQFNIKIRSIFDTRRRIVVKMINYIIDVVLSRMLCITSKLIHSGYRIAANTQKWPTRGTTFHLSPLLPVNNFTRFKYFFLCWVCRIFLHLGFLVLTVDFKNLWTNSFSYSSYFPFSLFTVKIMFRVPAWENWSRFFIVFALVTFYGCSCD